MTRYPNNEDPPRSDNWFVATEAGTVQFSLETLKSEIERGTVQRHNLVWREGMADWLELSQDPLLQLLLPKHTLLEQPPPPPVDSDRVADDSWDDETTVRPSVFDGDYPGKSAPPAGSVEAEAPARSVEVEAPSGVGISPIEPHETGLVRPEPIPSASRLQPLGIGQLPPAAQRTQAPDAVELAAWAPKPLGIGRLPPAANTPQAPSNLGSLVSRPMGIGALPPPNAQQHVASYSTASTSVASQVGEPPLARRPPQPSSQLEGKPSGIEVQHLTSSRQPISRPPERSTALAASPEPGAVPRPDPVPLRFDDGQTKDVGTKSHSPNPALLAGSTQSAGPTRNKPPPPRRSSSTMRAVAPRQPPPGLEATSIKVAAVNARPVTARTNAVVPPPGLLVRSDSADTHIEAIPRAESDVQTRQALPVASAVPGEQKTLSDSGNSELAPRSALNHNSLSPSISSVYPMARRGIELSRQTRVIIILTLGAAAAFLLIRGLASPERRSAPTTELAMPLAPKPESSLVPATKVEEAPPAPIASAQSASAIEPKRHSRAPAVAARKASRRAAKTVGASHTKPEQGGIDTHDADPVQAAVDTSDSKPDRGAADASDSKPDRGAADASDSKPDRGATDASDSRPDRGAADTNDSKPRRDDGRENSKAQDSSGHSRDDVDRETLTSM